MRNHLRHLRLLIIFTLTLWITLAKAEGYVTYLYQVKIELTDNRIVDGYFIDVDFPQTREFKNQNELKDFLIQKTRSKTGEIDKLYKSLFKILDFPTVDNWVRGHILFSKCEKLKITEKEITNVELIRSDKIPSQIIDNLTDKEINFLTMEPKEVLSLDLEDNVRSAGDIYLTYTLFSYTQDKGIDLKKIKSEIETEYFSGSKNISNMEKSRVWRKIFNRYKEQLQKSDILFLEIGDF